MVVKAAKINPPEAPRPDAFLVTLTNNRVEVAAIVKTLRDAEIAVETDPEARSAKSQFRQADRSGAKFAVVIGDDELASRHATVKELKTGSELKVAFELLVTHLKG